MQKLYQKGLGKASCAAATGVFAGQERMETKKRKKKPRIDLQRLGS